MQRGGFEKIGHATWFGVFSEYPLVALQLRGRGITSRVVESYHEVEVRGCPIDLREGCDADCSPG